MELSKAKKAPTGAVQVLLDPPGDAQRHRGLSSVGRAPALQAGCHRFESVRLHHFFDMIGKHLAFPSCRTRARHGRAFTSFREIIGVIGRTRVGVRCQYDPLGSESNNDVVQVKYTNQMRDCCMAIAQKVLSAWKGRETYMLLTGSEPCATQKDARRDRPSGLSSSGSNQAR